MAGLEMSPGDSVGYWDDDWGSRIRLVSEFMNTLDFGEVAEKGGLLRGFV